MGSVKADLRELKKLRDKLEKLQGRDAERQKFCEDCSKELAARLLALVIKRTPVDTGYLRHGWTGGENKSAKAYAEGCKVYKNGDNYTIIVENPVEYAPYVEFGHRTRGGKGWVAGQFMLTISEEELERIAPGILQRKLETFLQGVFS